MNWRPAKHRCKNDAYQSEPWGENVIWNISMTNWSLDPRFPAKSTTKLNAALQESWTGWKNHDPVMGKEWGTYSAKGSWNKSLNFIFPTKYVIPKSLKVSHWLSQGRAEPLAMLFRLRVKTAREDLAKQNKSSDTRRCSTSAHCKILSLKSKWNHGTFPPSTSMIIDLFADLSFWCWQTLPNAKRRKQLPVESRFHNPLYAMNFHLPCTISMCDLIFTWPFHAMKASD